MAIPHDIALDKIIWVDPERMSRIACFAGTRVPVQALLDHLEGGSTLDDFLEGFPTVKREQDGSGSRLERNQKRAITGADRGAIRCLCHD